MGEPDKLFVDYWISQHYAWELTTGVKLLLGIDPAKDKTKIDLSGNKKITRIYASAIKKVKEGKLKAIEEPTSGTGVNDYRVLRDDFVEWAHENYRNEAQLLYASWKSYKPTKPSEKTEKLYAEWQARIDDRFVFHHKNHPDKPNHHKHRCMDLAKELNPGLTGKELESKMETIRRTTRRRNRDWIMGKLGKK